MKNALIHAQFAVIFLDLLTKIAPKIVNNGTCSENSLKDP